MHKNEWIMCKDKLPSDGFYLVSDGENVGYALCKNGKFYSELGIPLGGIKAWMELPEPCDEVTE